MTVAYLAALGFENELRDELRFAGVEVTYRHDRLFITEAPAVRSSWSANVWLDARYLPITSIRDASDQLRAMQRGWAMYAPFHRGRAGLIEARLPRISAKPLALGVPAPGAPLGSWTLISPDLMFAAPSCTSAFANGEVTFTEDRNGPPSRAYLKLWEAFVRLGTWPQPGERCVDLGASPGGWTWSLAQLGAHVTAIDKAPLADEVAAMANVSWRSMSAFALEPKQAGHVDWLCSDVIAYPNRIHAMAQRWIHEGDVSHMVITIKLQGETDHEAVRAFAAIDGATVVHLHHNRHELTFLWSAA